MTAWGAVFARGGSQGVPGKNLRKIGQVSLLGHAIRLAQETPGIDRVLCSTDSAEIAKEAEKCGAWVPFMRPDHLAGNASPEWESWKHLCSFLMEQGGLESDTLVVLPTTAPLRDVADVSQAMTLAANSKADVVVTVTAAHRSPWFNMVTVDSRQRAAIVMNDRAGVVFRRQDSPDVFDLTTVAYVTNLGYVLSAANMFAGDVVASVVPPERAIDIDTELDLEIAEFLHHRKENGA